MNTRPSPTALPRLLLGAVGFVLTLPARAESTGDYFVHLLTCLRLAAVLAAIGAQLATVQAASIACTVSGDCPPEKVADLESAIATYEAALDLAYAKYVTAGCES